MTGLDQKLVQRLDTLYICVRCNAVFLFETDVQDHELFYGHEGVRKVPFT